MTNHWPGWRPRLACPECAVGRQRKKQRRHSGHAHLFDPGCTSSCHSNRSRDTQHYPNSKHRATRRSRRADRGTHPMCAKPCRLPHASGRERHRSSRPGSPPPTSPPPSFPRAPARERRSSSEGGFHWSGDASWAADLSQRLGSPAQQVPPRPLAGSSSRRARPTSPPCRLLRRRCPNPPRQGFHWPARVTSGSSRRASRPLPRTGARDTRCLRGAGRQARLAPDSARCVSTLPVSRRPRLPRA